MGGNSHRIRRAAPCPFRINDMDRAATIGRRRNRIAGSRRLGEPAEPSSDGGEHTHKAARPQQLPPCPPACAQKPIQPLLALSLMIVLMRHR
jgi:hypothetical protein